MKLKEVKTIMRKYGKSWENQDSDLILECFTKNATYQESPLAKPYKGHKEIKKFWEKVVVNGTKNIKFKLGKFYTSNDQKTYFVEWTCNNLHLKKTKWRKDRMAGIMILRMKNNKINYLNEYWNTKH